MPGFPQSHSDAYPQAAYWLTRRSKRKWDAAAAPDQPQSYRSKRAGRHSRKVADDSGGPALPKSSPQAQHQYQGLGDGLDVSTSKNKTADGVGSYCRGTPRDGRRRRVAFIARLPPRPRSLHQHAQLIAELSHALSHLRIDIEVVNTTKPPSYYEDLDGLIGVHGGDLANCYWLSPGTPVIEIGRKNPRLGLSMLCLGRQLHYRLYIASRFPLDYEMGTNATGKNQVDVNHANFLAFAEQVLSCRR